MAATWRSAEMPPATQHHRRIGTRRAVRSAGVPAAGRRDASTAPPRYRRARRSARRRTGTLSGAKESVAMQGRLVAKLMAVSKGGQRPSSFRGARVRSARTVHGSNHLPVDTNGLRRIWHLRRSLSRLRVAPASKGLSLCRSRWWSHDASASGPCQSLHRHEAIYIPDDHQSRILRDPPCPADALRSLRFTALTLMMIPVLNAGPARGPTGGTAGELDRPAAATPAQRAAGVAAPALARADPGRGWRPLAGPGRQPRGRAGPGRTATPPPALLRYRGYPLQTVVRRRRQHRGDPPAAAGRQYRDPAGSDGRSGRPRRARRRT